jgi:Predicted membrane protein (DUF2142)
MNVFIGAVKSIRMWRVAATCLLIGVLGLSWSLSSPIGSSPDDDFHLASIWCGSFASNQNCVEEGLNENGEKRVKVPATISGSIFCFVFNSNESAACQGQPDPEQFNDGRANKDSYPPGFYAVMSFFVKGSANESVVSMRLFSWSLATFLVGSAGLVLNHSLRRLYYLTTLITFVPLGVFLIASTNPSGLVIASIAAFWPLAYSLTRTNALSRRQAMARWALVGLVLLVATMSRGDAPGFLVVVFLAVLVLNQAWKKSVWKNVAALSTLLAGALLFSQLYGHSVVAQTSESLGETAVGWTENLWRNFTELPSLWIGSFGFWGLGWLDTPMPNAVGMLIVLSFAGCIFLGFERMDWGKAASLGILLAVLIVAPLVMLKNFGSVVGENVQPRYLLPLLPIFLLTSLTSADDSRPVILRRPNRLLLWCAMAIAHAVALHANFRRYLTGIDIRNFDLNRGREWWWPLTTSPMTFWFVGSLAFAVLLYLVLLPFEEDTGPEPSNQVSGAASPIG